MDLSGKIAVVTGASRGIGRAIAGALAGAGAQVAVGYEKNRAAAEAVAAGLDGAMAVQLTVEDRASVARAFDKVVSALGGLDILVNNAGINKPTDFGQISDDDWDRIMAVNLKGPFICAQLALPHMRARGGGAVVNIGSVSGQYGGPRTAHYAASKAGLISLGQVIARFGAPDNIRCNTVAAGLIESDMAAAGLKAGAVARAAEGILLGRMGSADEVARAVVFLASDAASYITAQTLNVNGGLYF
jgi:3-oxoacyl-[acyl-carrier protein] reductase